MAKYSWLAQALGGFSIALGGSQIVTPQGVSQAAGLGDHEVLMRVVGMREIAAGVGILSQPYPVGWVWGRVGGDLMDLALLGAALANEENTRGRVAGALAVVAGITALDVYCALQMSSQRRVSRQKREDPSRIVKTISINRSPEELYAFWRDFDNLPRFMLFLDSVQQTGGRRSTWSYKGPGRMRMQLDAEITEESEHRALAWRATSRSRFDMIGRVQFMRAPGEDRGTIVRLELHLGRGGTAIRLPRLLGQLPGEIVMQNLRRFKQLMEVGEILTNEGQPSGRRKHEKPVQATSERGEIAAEQTAEASL